MTAKLAQTVGLALLLIMGWRCSSAENPMQPMENFADVAIVGGEFVPKTITVPAGTTVRWTNTDPAVRFLESGAPMAPNNEFTSPNIQPGGVWTHLFSTRGTFNYFSSMTGATGTVVVQ